MTDEALVEMLTSVASDADVTRAFRALYGNLAQRGPEAKSVLLEKIVARADEVHPMLVVASFRLIFLHRDEISTWQASLEVARSSLMRRGIEPDAPLRGLDL